MNSDGQIHRGNACYHSALRSGLNFKLLIVFVLCASAACCASGRLQSVQLNIERAGLPPLAINTELARTQKERSDGLMHRKHLVDGAGMLFIFDRDQVMSFWMKNTLIPLSIAFIAADGRIVEIKDMQPHDLNPVISSRSVRYALEVPQGWFSRAGVKPGDVILLEGLGTKGQGAMRNEE